MCTAIDYQTKDCYFGRNLDLEFSYGETVTITPRKFPFFFRKAGECRLHYAIMGMAYVKDNYPLYYDAFNERVSTGAILNTDVDKYLAVGENGIQFYFSYDRNMIELLADNGNSHAMEILESLRRYETRLSGKKLY